MSPPKNIGKPQIDVQYVTLEIIELGKWKRKCPACKDGILLVRRDNTTLRLLESDRCISCGQLIKYIDIESMRDYDEGRTEKIEYISKEQ